MAANPRRSLAACGAWKSGVARLGVALAAAAQLVTVQLVTVQLVTVQIATVQTAVAQTSGAPAAAPAAPAGGVAPITGRTGVPQGGLSRFIGTAPRFQVRPGTTAVIPSGGGGGTGPILVNPGVGGVFIGDGLGRFFYRDARWFLRRPVFWASPAGWLIPWDAGFNGNEVRTVSVTDAGWPPTGSWEGWTLPAAYGGPAVVPPPPPPTVLERARLAMAARAWEDAIGLYEEALDPERGGNAEDHSAMRELGFALGTAGRLEQAASVVRLAYEQDPTLAARPVDVTWDGDGWWLRGLTRRAVREATEVPTGTNWLLVAVLMQADGRNDHALRMLERAEAAGLEGEVLSAMRAAVGG